MLSMFYSSIYRFIRASRARALCLCLLALLVAAAFGPHMMRAVRAQEAPPPAAGSQQKPLLASVPGEIVVRFRPAAAASKADVSALTVAAPDRRIDLQVERLAPNDVVEGLYLA